MSHSLDLALNDPEIARLVQNRCLSFPINTKADFIDQMMASGKQVVFRDVAYDTRFGAGLLPDFFFPLRSENDFVTKVTELLISRGLLALPRSPHPVGDDL